MSRPPELTPRQARFVDEYLIDLNATQAAIRAGYSANTAEVQGCRLLRNAHVAAATADRQAARGERTEATADRVLAELACMAFYDPGDIAGGLIERPEDICNLPEPVRRAIVGWGWDKNGNFTLKLSPKTPSLIEIGKHLGIAQHHEHTGKDGRELIPAETSSSKVALTILSILRGGEGGGPPRAADDNAAPGQPKPE